MGNESYGFLHATSADPDEAAFGKQELREYLRRFGYLAPPTATFTVEKESDEEELARALRRYQSFYRLPVTGTLDDATAAQMTRPRCGVPDRPSISFGDAAVLTAQRWPGPVVTFGIVTPPTGISSAAASSALAQAAALWDAVISLSLTSSFTPNLKVEFLRRSHGDSRPFDGPGKALGHAFDPPPHSRAGQMHHDDEETWATSLPIPTGAFDLVTHFAHELGHALGLRDHSQDSSALMHADYNGPHRFLAAEDISRIRAIYGP